MPRAVHLFFIDWRMSGLAQTNQQPELLPKYSKSQRHFEFGPLLIQIGPDVNATLKCTDTAVYK
jgi:hypothetical protein